MNEETHLANITLLEEFLQAEGSYTTEEHATFGRIFQFTIVPCCFPLNAVLWVNPGSNGIFTRIFFPDSCDSRHTSNIYPRLNEFNYSMPAGALVINNQNGQLIFQNAIFIGDTVAQESLIWQFLASSCDLVSSRFATIMELATGAKHEHENET